MKKLLLFLCLLAVAIPPIAARVKIGDLYYNLNDKDKTAQVTYYVYYDKNNNYVSGDVVIPEVVSYNSTDYTVTSIDTEAFYYCINMTSIIIPNTVTTIGTYAFSSCHGLTSITIPNSVTIIEDRAFYDSYSLSTLIIEDGEETLTLGNYTANNTTGKGLFYDCPLTKLYLGRNLKYESGQNYGYSPFYNQTKLSELIIGNSVTSIGEYAFYYCKGLTSIEIPNSVTSIGDNAFYGCSALTSIEIPNSVTSIGDNAFMACTGLTSVVIPNTVTSIGHSAFEGCSALKSIEIPNSVTSIGNYAFMACTGLTSVVIPNSVTSIGWFVFYGCSGLTSIEIPNSITSIGDNAFDGCSGLTSIEIPNSVTSIGDNAFGRCSNLKEFRVEDGDKTIAFGSQPLLNCPIENLYMGRDWTYSGSESISTGIKSVTIGNKVTTLPNNAFNGCSSLTSVTIGNSITSIGDNAFYGCSSLTSIEIPNSVTSIGVSAFSDCSGLTSIEIPNSLTSIGDRIFYGCSGLTSIEIPNSVTSIGSAAFSGCTSLTSIEIPNSVTSIGTSAFEGCSAVTSIEIPNSVTSIGTSAFNGCNSLSTLVLEDGEETLTLGFNQRSSNGTGKGLFADCPLTKLYLGRNLKYESGQNYGYSPFYNQTKLSELTIGNSVTSIGNYAFYGCSGLKKVEISDLAVWFNINFSNAYANPLFYAEKLYLGDSEIIDLVIPDVITSIGNYTFYNCTGLKSVSIPNSVTSIGGGAFSFCSGLTSLEIPNSVTSIGEYAFRYCTGLTKLTFNAKTCSGNGFSSDYHWLSSCSKLSEVKIGDNVNYIPSYAFYDLSNLTSIEIPNSVTSIGQYAFRNCTGLKSISIGNSVTTIGNYAFNGCSAVTSIEIPNSVTSIGQYAFRNCTGLTKLTFNAKTCSGNGFSSDYHWLSSCSKLREVKIGDNVKSIPDYAFYDLSNLTSIGIPNSVTSIGDYAFNGCSGLTSIEIPKPVIWMGKYTFRNCTGLTKFIYNAEDLSWGGFASSSSHCLNGCSNLSEIVIGESVKTIQNNLLYDCSNVTKLVFNAVNCQSVSSSWLSDCSKLNEVVIGESVKTLPSNFLYNIRGLKSIEIPNSVTSIGSSAFSGCTSLTSIEIPNSVTSIGEYAFRNCTGLTKLTFNAKACSGSGFSNNYHWLSGCSKLSEVKIGDNVNYIPSYAFYDLSNLTSIEIPNSVTSIGDRAFLWCYGLTSLEIPNSITSIGSYAFSYCTGLTNLIYNAEDCSGSGFSSSDHWLSGCSKLREVKIGDNVKSIPGYAFYNLSNLTNIDIPASVTSIGNSAFNGCSNIETVNTPSLEAWTAIEFGNEESNPTYYAKTLLVNGEAIRRMTLPTDITELHSYAFINCESLFTATCGSEILNVGTNVFSGCTDLQRISFSALKDFLQINYLDNQSALTYNNDAVIYINGSPLDYTNIDWPETITEIPDYAFYQNAALKHIDIPQTVVSIGKYAFDQSGISEVSLPDDLQKFGMSAFGHTAITDVTIPSRITEIPDSAFYNCYSMTKVSLPASLKSIGSYAFSSCSSLNEVEIEDVDRWATVEFGNIDANPIYYARTFRQSNMEEPIRKLNLKDVNHISPYAFFNASNLQTIRIEADSIGTYAFYGCDNVTDLCIDTEEISEYAFSGMTGLQNIYSLTSTPPAAPDNAFSKYNDINLYVPQGSVSAYENAENCWWRFLDIFAGDLTNLDSIFAPDYTSGIADVENEAACRVYSANGCIYVDAISDADTVAIFNLQGRAIHQGHGATAIDVVPGIYIVIVNNQSTKLSVR